MQGIDEDVVRDVAVELRVLLPNDTECRQCSQVCQLPAARAPIEMPR